MDSRFGKLIFSVGEQEIIRSLQEDFNQPFITAVDLVVGQKREAAMIWRRRGNDALADQLLREIGELR